MLCAAINLLTSRVASALVHLALSNARHLLLRLFSAWMADAAFSAASALSCGGGIEAGSEHMDTCHEFVIIKYSTAEKAATVQAYA